MNPVEMLNQATSDNDDTLAKMVQMARDRKEKIYLISDDLDAYCFEVGSNLDAEWLLRYSRRCQR